MFITLRIIRFGRYRSTYTVRNCYTSSLVLRHLDARGRFSDISGTSPELHLLHQREHRKTAMGACNDHDVNTYSGQWRTSQSHAEASSIISQPGIAGARAILQAREEQVRRRSQRYVLLEATLYEGIDN